MITINVKKAGSLDRAIKQLKQKFRKTGITQELRDRKEFTKPSVKKRKTKKKAIYKQSLNNN